ncbi:MAG TPA: biopolymer transporter ExbD [Gemmatimonadales bacterium]|jgi:biopolymer transport protein ExbD/biopolymer transport protein TolR|nr:biopolymer transporter ExbD [Gemmatimonadales bacterium]
MALGGAKKTEGAVAANINVTPMIDVMLVLLIIFMIVTPAITAGFQATLPRAKNPDSREEGDGEVRLGIDRDGKFYLDITDPRTGKYTGPRSISDEDLPAQLTSLYANRTVDKIMYLKADEGIDYGRVQAALEIARKSGVRVVGAIAEQERAVRPEH